MIGALIFAIGGGVEILIGLRFIFRLFGANPASGFVEGVYNWSTPFVAPFSGIFGQESTITGSGVVTASVFDWTALVAFIIVGLVVGLIGRIFSK